MLRSGRRPISHPRNVGLPMMPLPPPAASCPPTLPLWVGTTDFAAGILITVGSMEVWLRHTSPTGKVLRSEGNDAHAGKAARAKAS